jgi:hypothetical protein
MRLTSIFGGYPALNGDHPIALSTPLRRHGINLQLAAHPHLVRNDLEPRTLQQTNARLWRQAAGDVIIQHIISGIV